MQEKKKPKVTHAAVKKQQRRGGSMGWVALPIIGAIAIIGVALWTTRSTSPALAGVQQLPDQGNAHLSALTQKHPPYNSDPPTSGPHMPSLLRWAFYDEPEPAEYLVHNLEDGGVVVYYKPKVLEAVKTRLKELQQTKPNFTIVVPGSDTQSEEVILTAWNVMLRQPQYDDAAARAFVAHYGGIDHHVSGAG